MGSEPDLRQLPVQEHPGPPETEQGKEVPSRKPSEGERFQWLCLSAPKSDIWEGKHLLSQEHCDELRGALI